MEKGLIVTPRDLGLLYDCYQQVALSFVQIRNRHFPSAAKPTIINRLSALRKASLLTSQEIGTFVHKSIPCKIGVVYQVTKKAIELLANHFSNENFREEPFRLNSASLPHDLMLTEVLACLRQRFPNSKILNGKLLYGDDLRAQRLPDAVFINDPRNPYIAVELELTAKSKKRYREIVMTYKLQSTFKKILYVVANQTILDKIHLQITQQKKVPGLQVKPTDRFYFVLLDELLQSPLHAKITNGSSEFAP